MNNGKHEVMLKFTLLLNIYGSLIFGNMVLSPVLYYDVLGLVLG